jgi:hypothetical protein
VQQDGADGLLQHPQARFFAAAPQSPAGITAAKPKLIAKATNIRIRLPMVECMRVSLVHPTGKMFKAHILATTHP